MKLVGHPITGLFDCCTNQFEVFSRFFTMAEFDCWCISQCIYAGENQSCEMDTSKRDQSLMVFTVTSSDCKVKKARFYEFLFTPG